MKTKLGILDFGGQYAHLIAARVRHLGVYCEILSPIHLKPEDVQKEYAGLIFSGGPNSVYEEGVLACDVQIYRLGLPILGICYGHQLLIKQAGGVVKLSKKPEFGPAPLLIKNYSNLFYGIDQEKNPIVWMSHVDEVEMLPSGFEVLAQTEDCSYAAVGDINRNLFGLQFHPEVQESEWGLQILKNFISICNVETNWTLKKFLKEEEEKIFEQVGDRKVFFLLSGGVDSTVAFALLARYLKPENLIGLHIDTGFMRHNESKQVKEALGVLGTNITIWDASEQFYTELEGIVDSEKKRQIIGELFIQVQRSASESLGLDEANWFLGQGTIYPDQIESGSSQNSSRIKTHHNRVEGIEKLIRAGRVVEPIQRLYKDEVRKLGALLGLPSQLLERHPFPGPGLAVRCLCSDKKEEKKSSSIPSLLERESFGFSQMQAIEDNLKKYRMSLEKLPIRSVGVQGDQRSYKHCLALFYEEDFPDWAFLMELARLIPNRVSSLNRVVLFLGKKRKEDTFQLDTPSYLTKERIGLLRKADAVATEFFFEKDIYHEIWQCPVVLLPLKKMNGPTGNVLILRPVCSINAMTASVYPMKIEYIRELNEALRSIPQCVGVFYDLTSKPPGTIEWE